MKCITESHRPEGGFTLVELMISLVLGLIVIGGSLALFVSQRVTSSLSGQMAEVQSEGRIALDGLARDLRAAGDFGCWPVANPIDGRLNQMVFNVTTGGIVGYNDGSSLPGAAATDAPYGVGKVSAANPAAGSSVVALTGVNGTLTQTIADMTSQADSLVVKKPAEPFAVNDVAVITDCINWAKFQVTGIAPGSAADSFNLLHAGGVNSTWGKGNKDENLGAVFRKDSTVGRLDTVWWFVGANGLYRMSSAHDAAPVLVTKRVYALKVSYDLDANEDGIIDSTGNTASQVTALLKWPLVRSATVEMLMRSEKEASGGGVASVASFAGQTIPTDKRLYLPLQMTVALRNQ